MKNSQQKYSITNTKQLRENKGFILVMSIKNYFQKVSKCIHKTRLSFTQTQTQNKNRLICPYYQEGLKKKSVCGDTPKQNPCCLNFVKNTSNFVKGMIYPQKVYSY